MRGPRSSGPSFSFTTFPDGKHFQFAVMFFAVAGVFFTLPMFFPEINQEGVVRKLILSSAEYELTNEIQAGQFHLTKHKGDTRASADATFWGISTLYSPRASGIASSKNEARAKAYVQQLEAKDFNRNAKDIYQGIVMMKRLGIYNAKKHNEKYYSALLDLAESSSGFKLTALHTPSTTATFYAFKSIEELGKFDDFKATPQYKSAIDFVSSLKEQVLGGFSDVVGVNATLQATYYAVQVVPTEVCNGTETFVYACQAQDGGFAAEPLESMAAYYFTQSSLVNTVRGIFILETLGYYSSNPFDFLGNSNANANSFVRFYLNDKTNLEATYHFLGLIQQFPSFKFGTSRSIPFIFWCLGALFATFGVLAFYKPQLPEEAIANVNSQFTWVSVFILAAAVGATFNQLVATFSYIALAFYVAIQYYEAQSVDTTDGVMILIGSVSSMAFMGLVMSFVYLSPFVYAQAATYLVLLGWFALVTFLTAYGSCFFIGKQQLKASFLSRAGFLGWVGSNVLLYMFLLGRADIEFLSSLIELKGLYDVVWVAFPMITLPISYYAAAIGYLMYASK